ncbi:MAG TPA: GNAT family N-acetyltransferase [Gaiellaceae bacterium]
MDDAALLTVYDAQLRAHISERLPEGVVVEHDGPVTRFLGFGGQGWVEYHDLGDIGAPELDALIARQIERFAEIPQRFEWKLHGHDGPAFLNDRLLAAGLRPEEQETVVIAAIADLDLTTQPPDGVRLREVYERADLDRIATMEAEVWDDKGATRAQDLERERAADPGQLRIVVAEAGDAGVSAGWIRFPSGTEFGTLWGGSTLAAWRGRGIYRSLVAHRARLAAENGRRYLEVDASDDSRPILERLGFRPITTTTPYIWSSPR